MSEIKSCVLIPEGTHLVTIIEAKTERSYQNKRIEGINGYGIIITFSTGDNKLCAFRFWTENADFKKLCKDVDADLSKPICPELTGKRLWGVFNSRVELIGCMKCEHPLHVPEINHNPDEDRSIADGLLEPLKCPPYKNEMSIHEARIATGKAIIDEVMGKKLTSLNQKNKPTQEAPASDPNWDLL